MPVPFAARAKCHRLVAVGVKIHVASVVMTASVQQLPGGALLMDTPGLREFRAWALDQGLGHAFPEIEEVASACRFRDCQHESEPGCSVTAAAHDGRIEPDRLASYRKLRAEAAYIERKSDHQAHAASVAKHKTALKTLKYHQKYRRNDG